MFPRGVRCGRFLAVLKDAETQKIEAGSAVLLACNELEAMHLPFDVTLAPRKPECFANGVDVPFESSSEARQCGTSCSVEPCWQRIQDAEEACVKLADPADLG